MPAVRSCTVSGTVAGSQFHVVTRRLCADNNFLLIKSSREMRYIKFTIRYPGTLILVWKQFWSYRSQIIVQGLINSPANGLAQEIQDFDIYWFAFSVYQISLIWKQSKLKTHWFLFTPSIQDCVLVHMCRFGVEPWRVNLTSVLYILKPVNK